MATTWEDLFKFNTELLTDDYNKGQALVIKTKAKSEDNVTVSISEISASFEKKLISSDSCPLNNPNNIGS
jgi:hypothetical protein